MIVILRFEKDLDAIDRLLILPIFQNCLFLFSQIALYLHFLVQIADIGLGKALICHKLLHLSRDVTEELLSEAGQSRT